MDAFYFLKRRTDFIRFYYDTSAKPFIEVRRCIDEKLPPYDDPPYSEDPEPAFFDEWMDAATAEQILGLSCVSLLSESMKLYFETLQKHVIRFAFKDKKDAFKQGFVSAYLGALSGILETDWSDCPVDLAVVEQIVLARNRGQHGGDLTSFNVTYEGTMLAKHPQPFFASADESKNWTLEDENISSYLFPSIKVTRDNLFAAVEQVEKLGEWIDGKMGNVLAWRQRNALDHDQ